MKKTAMYWLVVLLPTVFVLGWLILFNPWEKERPTAAERSILNGLPSGAQVYVEPVGFTEDKKGKVVFATYRIIYARRAVSVEERAEHGFHPDLPFEGWWIVCQRQTPLSGRRGPGRWLHLENPEAGCHSQFNW